MSRRISIRMSRCVVVSVLTMSIAASRVAAQPTTARTVTKDGVLSFVLARAQGSVVVRDLLNDSTLATTHVCPRATAAGLSSDDVSFVVACPGAAPMAVNSATIIPTAGWTRPMDLYRNAALARLAKDLSRRAQWTEYLSAARSAHSVVRLLGSDDPYFVNSPRYNSLQTAAHVPYNVYFNRDLGPGGWDNINTSHFGHIRDALDAHRGEGMRFVITYGAGHKEWFLRALRKRNDIVILDVAPFLAQIGAQRTPSRRATTGVPRLRRTVFSIRDRAAGPLALPPHSPDSPASIRAMP